MMASSTSASSSRSLSVLTPVKLPRHAGRSSHIREWIDAEASTRSR
jgi:hypothetical protein